jgi:hypothetical protein
LCAAGIALAILALGFEDCRVKAILALNLAGFSFVLLIGFWIGTIARSGEYSPNRGTKPSEIDHSGKAKNDDLTADEKKGPKDDGEDEPTREKKKPADEDDSGRHDKTDGDEKLKALNDSDQPRDKKTRRDKERD